MSASHIGCGFAARYYYSLFSWQAATILPRPKSEGRVLITSVSQWTITSLPAYSVVLLWMPGAMISGRFWAVVAILLGVMAALQFFTARQESQTFDESNQLLSGYTYLTTGHFTVSPEHPPLLKLLWAVPVALLRPSPAPTDGTLQAGREFLYHNRVPADTMLMAGRCSAIAIAVLLGVAIAFWAKRHFGERVALLSVFLYACDPNFLANGRYMKNDVGAALMIFSAAMLWGEYLMEPTRKRLWLSGLVLGLALTTKFSALVLGPVMLLLYGVHRWLERRAFGLGECVRSLLSAGAIAFLVILAVYRFDIGPLRGSGLPIPAPAFFRGLGEIGLKQTERGLWIGYLLGALSHTGWWYMSPVAFLAKTPLGELALFALAIGTVPVRLKRLRVRGIGFRWFLLAVPAACYFGVSLLAHFNAGERHLLPVYPFVFIFSAAVVLAPPVPKWRWAAAALCALILVMETASIHPHYLAFFNALAGGPVGGRHVLVDSNLDWGQDVKNLKSYLDTHHIPGVCMAYFGMANLAYYGIRSRALPAVPDEEAALQLDCVAAISVTWMAVQGATYAGLDEMEPDARIGYSIYVYDLRHQAKPASQ